MNPVYKFAIREDLLDVTEFSFLPTRAEPKATGWDVRAAFPDRKSVIVKPFQKLFIPLGVRGFCPDGWWYEIKPRSSSYAKKHLNALYGTIDETYEGELIFACQYIPTVPYKTLHDRDGLSWDEAEEWSEFCGTHELKIDFGDAIGQIIPRERQEMTVQSISNAEYVADCVTRDATRREGGFGSTGK